MKKVSIILVAAIIIGAIIFQIKSYNNVNTITAKVEGKERVTEGTESYYLVYTDKLTMKLEDDMFRGNYYSSDVYGKIKQDSIYTFTTSGYRSGWLSSYPNNKEVQ